MIRKMLDLSTSYLPPALLDELGSGGHVVRGCMVTPMEYGLLLWVPDDPQAHADELNAEFPAGEPGELGERLPAEILTIQLYARGCGCDYVMFDADGELVPDGTLPRFEH